MNTQHGVWPTMITPFTPGAEGIDFDAVGAMVEFYVQSGCKGIFAVCQSSEMFFLSPEERISLARAVVKAADGRIDVIASGHVSEDVCEAAEHVRAMAQAGAKAVVLVSNRFARQEESDDIWVKNASRLLDETGDVPLGLYECPYPYKLPLTDKVLDFCRESGRFRFIKDTSCDTGVIRHRLGRIAGSGISLYNANAATLLESMECGAAGYSGVMANYHPHLYVRLMQLYNEDKERARLLQAYLTMAACLEARCYPISAKYYMAQRGIQMGLDARCRSVADFSYASRVEIEQLMMFEDAIQQI